MRIHLGIVTATPELLYDAVKHAAECAAQPFDLHVFANVNQDIDTTRIPKERVPHVTVQGSPENVGFTLGLHRIWESISQTATVDPNDIVVYIHDDLNILEYGWDDRVRRLFEKRPNVMLAGFGGARQLGDVCLYRVPYELRFLARYQYFSNTTNAEQHGGRASEEMHVSTLDSFSMILRAKFLGELGGWDWWPYPAHNVDNAVCCEARKRGYETWLIPVLCFHNGGRTSCGPIYQNWVKEKFGGDRQVYEDSHALLYERYRGTLPMLV